MTKAEHKLNLSILVIAVICLAALFLNDHAVVLNPNGYGDYGTALMFVAAVAGLVCTVLSLRRLAAEKLSATILIGCIVWPTAGLLVHLFLTVAVPALALAASASSIQVPVTVISSEVRRNSSACTVSRGRLPVAYVVRVEGQPFLLGDVCVKSLEGRTSNGQKALFPPPMPDPGPVVIEGQGNWFAVKVERFVPA